MSINVLPGYPLIENMPLKASGGIAADWLALIKDFPDRFMIGSDQFYFPPCGDCRKFNSVTPSRRWLELLPVDIARKIALDNPRRVFKLNVLP